MRVALLVPMLLYILPGGSVGYAQQDAQAAIFQEIEESRSILFNIEESVSNVDLVLLEPLEQLAVKLMENQLFVEAHSTLDRAMQIARINEGLYTDTQLPFLGKKIENFVNWGDWDHARDLMEHMLWLLQTKNTSLSEKSVDTLLHLSTVHLRGIGEDSRRYQGYHFRQAERLNRGALDIAQLIWGLSDPRLVEIYYNQVKHYHLQAMAINNGGSTGYQLREIAPGAMPVRGRAESKRLFYLRGLALLDRIKYIFATSEQPDYQAIATSDLFLADWHVLFDQNQEAIEYYRRSYQGLVQAELSPEQINDFFGQPVLLPEPNFYPKINDSRNKTIDSSPTVLNFEEWSRSLPNVEAPSTLQTALAPASGVATFSFNLTGVNDNSLWAGGRFQSDSDMVQNVELIATDSTYNFLDEEMSQKLMKLRFRPVLLDGAPQDTSGILKYFFANSEIQTTR